MGVLLIIANFSLGTESKIYMFFFKGRIGKVFSNIQKGERPRNVRRIYLKATLHFPICQAVQRMVAMRWGWGRFESGDEGSEGD